MAVDVTSLEIRIKSLEAVEAGNRLDDLEKKAKKTEKASNDLVDSFKKLVAAYISWKTVVAGGREVVRVTREFDILNAGLITATESAVGAAEAFTAIQDFAQRTPYDLQQVTDGFITLVNRGLEPSERALTAYGDTAASLGRSLSDYINAVAQGTVGEFESLKTFGVRAKNQGDTIAFTFRGVTETVKNSARDIEHYLIQLGEVNFAGAMERRMDSLDGKLSNFGDAWDKLVLDISKGGLGKEIERNVSFGIDVLDALGYHVRVLSNQANLSDIDKQIKETSIDLLDASNMLKRFQDAGHERKIQLYTQSVAELEARLASLSSTRVSLSDRVTTDDALAKFQALSSGDPTQLNQLKLSLMTEEEAVQYSYEQRNKIILDRKKTIDDAVLAAEKLLQQNLSAEQRKSTEAKLATFRQERADFIAIQADLLEKSKRQYEAEKNHVLASLTDQLESEGVAISKAYDDRQKLIDQFYADDEAKRLQASARNLEIFDEETAALAEKETQRVFELERARIAARQSREDLNERLLTEAEAYIYFNDLIEQAEREHQQVMDEIKTNAYLTDVERMEALQKEEIRFAEAKAKAAVETDKLRLDSAAATAQGLAQIAAGIFGQESKAAKVMFAIQKAFSIASSIIAIQQGIAKAMAVGWPANIPIIAQTVATGAGIISTIKGTQLPQFDSGGYLGAGQFGIVGERGPEIVRGPLNITSRRETAQAARQAISGGNKQVVFNATFNGVSRETADSMRAEFNQWIIDEMRTGGALEALA